jgi:hypothetical protein
MWLLGAYTELVKLNMMRAHAVLGKKPDRQAYYDQLVTLKLAGGGFPAFDRLRQKWTGSSKTWMQRMRRPCNPPSPRSTKFSAASTGSPTRSSPCSTARPTCRKTNSVSACSSRARGSWAKGRIGSHFFGDLTMRDLLVYGAQEKVQFARPVLNWQHKRAFKTKIKAEKA